MSTYVPQVSPLSRVQIEQKATAILRDFCPQCLLEPMRFSALHFFDHYIRKKYELDTGVEKLGDGIEGLAFPDGRVIVSEQTYYLADGGNGRARFTICHECFHGIQHRHQIRERLTHTNLVLHRRSNLPAYVDPEWQANVFASAILMPAKAVLILANSSGQFGLVNAISQKFGVSRQAAEVRIEKLKL